MEDFAVRSEIELDQLMWVINGVGDGMVPQGSEALLCSFLKTVLLDFLDCGSNQ